MITNQLLRKSFFRGWSAGVAMVAMVATGQKSPKVPCRDVGATPRGQSDLPARRGRRLATRSKTPGQERSVYGESVFGGGEAAKA